MKKIETLEDTVNLMLSKDYKDRMRGEYWQCLLRMRGLDKFIKDVRDGKLPKGFNTPISMLIHQLHTMLAYLNSLANRCLQENIVIHTGCLDENSQAEFIGELVDILEDWIDGERLDFKNPEKDEAIESGETDEDNAAHIYGSPYGIISCMAEHLISDMELIYFPIGNETNCTEFVDSILDAYNDTLLYGECLDERFADAREKLSLQIRAMLSAWDLYL